MEMLCLIVCLFVCLFACKSLHTATPLLLLFLTLPDPLSSTNLPLFRVVVCVFLGMKHKYYAYATVDTGHMGNAKVHAATQPFSYLHDKFN